MPEYYVQTLYRLFDKHGLILLLIKGDKVYNEQKGTRKGCWGCNDQLLVQKMILEEAKTYPRYLSMCWIDYRKAYDSVPHEWIIEVTAMCWPS